VLGSLGQRSTAAREAIAGAVATPDGDFFTTVLEADAQLSLVDDMLHYFDRASMAHSLEVRVPFLDHHFVEFCATIPRELKVRRSTTKYLLKRAARGLVPDRIIDKPKAGFFYPALNAWLRAEAATVRDLLLSRDARTSAFLDRRATQRLVDDQFSVGGMTEPLLTVLMLEAWLRSVDASTAEPMAVSANTATIA
jgi:asparagine synthase (glutamine-hydrolysing)